MDKPNPKDIIGAKKLPMYLIPGTAKAYMVLALLEGALKYGAYNYRVSGAKASIYLDAIERHLEKWKNGENADPKTRVHHLGSIMASCAILIDAEQVGVLTDDRPPRAPVAEVIDSLTPVVAHLQELFKDCNPHQNTIEDSPWAPEKAPKLTTISTTELRKLRNRERLATRRVAKLKKKAKSIKATAKK